MTVTMGVSEVEPTDFALGQNFRHVFDSCLCNIISGWRTELLWNSFGFFCVKIEKEVREKKKEGGGRWEPARTRMKVQKAAGKHAHRGEWGTTVLGWQSPSLLSTGWTGVPY